MRLRFSLKPQISPALKSLAIIPSVNPLCAIWPLTPQSTCDNVTENGSLAVEECCWGGVGWDGVGWGGLSSNKSRHFI